MLTFALHIACLFDAQGILKYCGDEFNLDECSGCVIDGLGQNVGDDYSGRDVTLINATVSTPGGLAVRNENITILKKGGPVAANISCDGCIFLQQEFPFESNQIEGSAQQYVNGYLSLNNGTLSNAELYLRSDLKGVSKLENCKISANSTLLSVESIENCSIDVNIADFAESAGFEGEKQSETHIFTSVVVNNSHLRIMTHNAAQLANEQPFKPPIKLAGSLTIRDSQLEVYATAFSSSSSLVDNFDCSGSLLTGHLTLIEQANETQFSVFGNTKQLIMSVIYIIISLASNLNDTKKAESFSLFSVPDDQIIDLKGSVLWLNISSSPLFPRSNASYFFLFQGGRLGEISASISAQVNYFEKFENWNNQLRLVYFGGVDFVAVDGGDGGVDEANGVNEVNGANEADKSEIVFKDSLNKNDASNVAYFHYRRADGINGNFLNAAAADLPMFDWGRRGWNASASDSDIEGIFDFSQVTADVAFRTPLKINYNMTNYSSDSGYERKLLDSCRAPMYFSFAEGKCSGVDTQVKASEVETAMWLMVAAIVLCCISGAFFAYQMCMFKKETKEEPQERPVSKLNPMRAPNAPFATSEAGDDEQSPKEEKVEVMKVAAQEVDYAAEYERLMGK